MPAAMKTPGVYIVEKNAFPNSVVEVATAVPAFIGYTEWADNKGKSLANVPWRIASMAEFQSYFGGAPPARFNVKTFTPPAPDPTKPPQPLPSNVFSLTDANSKITYYQVTPAQPREQQFLLYHSMLLFFQNGGGPCYIVSVGPYSDPADPTKPNSIIPDPIKFGIDLLLKEQEPTMIVIPDAVNLKAEADCISVQQAALSHCGDVQSRIAILDLYNGYLDRKDPSGDWVTTFRSDLGINFLNYASAYYPWLNTSILSDSDIGYLNLESADLTALLTAENVAPKPTLDEVNALATYPALVAAAPDHDPKNPNNPLDKVNLPARLNLLNSALPAASPAYVKAAAEIKRQLNLLPPSPAIAGVYTMVDNTKGVWKAPANVSLNSVISPTVNISHDDQEDLNVDVTGKSINAIRSFVGEGVLVWGARTLDGNSLDWRYVGVRRTMIFLEQSIKLATKAYVFENNVSTTWVTIKSMIRNFLTSVWKRGGLAGASPDDAFGVFCGLGETMTPDDILEGILRVTVLVAITRPAEFIEITFQQQMQKS